MTNWKRDEKDSIETAIKNLEEVMKGEDKEQIESLTKALAETSGKMAERLYAQSQAGGEGGGPSGAGAGDGAGGESAKAAADDVVDAEFEEVKEDKK
mgnify:FL=1